MRTVDEFAARAATLPRVIVDTTSRAVKAGGVVLEDAVRANVSRATGGDMRLSRVRSGKGATIKLDLKVTGAGSRAEAHVVPTGPIMLVELGAVAHRQPFVYKVKRRVKKRTAKVVAFGGKVYGRVNHPGTAGKFPVRKAFDQAGSAAGRAGAQVFATAARNHLGGS